MPQIEFKASRTETMSENEPVVVSSEKPEVKRRTEVIIRMWPKTPVLYPMALVALICGILTQIWGGQTGEAERTSVGMGEMRPLLAQVEGGAAPEEGVGEVAEVEGVAEVEVEPVEREGSLDRTLGILFLFAMFISLFTLCVNLDIRWGLIFVSSMVILALVGVIANRYFDFAKGFFDFLGRFDPAGNAPFYYGVFGVWAILMVISYLVSRFHYVRIEPNEVLVIGGMLERQQRYSTMRMRYTKEVLDVLEYYLPLVRSGRLILSFPEQNEAVIIDNVINLKKVMEEIDDLISSMRVVKE